MNEELKMLLEAELMNNSFNRRASRNGKKAAITYIAGYSSPEAYIEPELTLNPFSGFFEEATR